jgi:hypothetical protein
MGGGLQSQNQSVTFFEGKSQTVLSVGFGSEVSRGMLRITHTPSCNHPWFVISIDGPKKYLTENADFNHSRLLNLRIVRRRQGLSGGSAVGALGLSRAALARDAWATAHRGPGGAPQCRVIAERKQGREEVPITPPFQSNETFERALPLCASLWSIQKLGT